MVNGNTWFRSQMAAYLNGLAPYLNVILEYANVAAFPVTGEDKKIYIDLSTNELYIWNGASYDAVSSAGGGSTVLTTSDDFYPLVEEDTFAFTYEVGSVAVFVGGTLLDPDLYTADNGTSVVLDNPVDIGTWVQIVGGDLVGSTVAIADIVGLQTELTTLTDAVALNTTHAGTAHAPSNADNTAANETSHLNVVVDASYVHTDNNLTNVLKSGYDGAVTHAGSAHAPANADNTAANETSHTDVLVDGDTVSPVTALNKLVTETEISGLGGGYTHPTYTGDDINVDTGPLTGATVISDLDFNITTNTQGHVTDANAAIATRNLTAANIGAQPAGTYNTVIGTDTDVNTSGAQIIDNLFMTDGVITSHGTRNLTAADIGAVTGNSGNYVFSSFPIGNVSSITQYGAEWIQIGNRVFVTGTIKIIATFAGVATTLEISAPVNRANNYTSQYQAHGVFASNIGNQSGKISADIGTKRLQFNYTPTTDSSCTFGFHFSYTI